jgi:hypothetical protein
VVVGTSSVSEAPPVSRDLGQCCEKGKGEGVTEQWGGSHLLISLMTPTHCLKAAMSSAMKWMASLETNSEKVCRQRRDHQG